MRKISVWSAFLFVFLFGTSFSHAHECIDWVTGMVSARSAMPRFLPSRQEHFAQFWSLHKRFGIYRENNRLILLARDQQIANQVVADLRAYSGRALPAPPVPMQNAIGHDITEVATPFMRLFHERYANSDGGPNCYNLCLRQTGVGVGIHCTSRDEFSHWLNSTLATPIYSAAQLRPGDVFAYRVRKSDGTTREVHGAIYISPLLVFTKNGSDRMVPYLLQDFDESFSIAVPEYANSVSIFRLRPLREFLHSHQAPARLLEILGEVEEYEKALSARFFDADDLVRILSSFQNVPINYNSPRSEIRRYQSGRLRELRAAIKEELQHTTDPIWRNFYEGLDLRVSSVGNSTTD